MKYLFGLLIILSLIFCQGNCFAQERTEVRYVQNNEASIGISQSINGVNEVKVFSMQGKLLGTYKSIEQAKTTIASGMYVVKTVDGQNQEHVTKMIL